MPSIVWNEITNPSVPLKQSHPTFYIVRNYLSILRLKLIQASKIGPNAYANTVMPYFVPHE